MSPWMFGNEYVCTPALCRFGRIVGRDDVRLAKPDPEGWQLIDDGTPRQRYLFVGDSSNDEGAATALGIDYFTIRFFK